MTYKSDDELPPWEDSLEKCREQEFAGCTGRVEERLQVVGVVPALPLTFWLGLAMLAAHAAGL